MNASFVCVKVDREERPDLDHVYQLVVRATGRAKAGRSPSSRARPEAVLRGNLLPAGRPARHARIPESPPRRAPSVSNTPRRRPRALRRRLARAIEQATAIGASTGGVSAELVRAAGRALTERFDDDHGGFGHRPKFPSTMSLDVLLRAGERAALREDPRGDAGRRYLRPGRRRLPPLLDRRKVARPLREMLYDNALLLRLYAEGWRVSATTRTPTAAEIAAYVAREMTDPGGGFYATQDADSEGEEGRFFVWRPGRDRRGVRFRPRPPPTPPRHVYGVTAEGNFEHTGATVLSIVHAPDGDEEAAALERARRLLFEARERGRSPRATTSSSPATARS